MGKKRNLESKILKEICIKQLGDELVFVSFWNFRAIITITIDNHTEFSLGLKFKFNQIGHGEAKDKLFVHSKLNFLFQGFSTLWIKLRQKTNTRNCYRHHHHCHRLLCRHRTQCVRPVSQKQHIRTQIEL